MTTLLTTTKLSTLAIQYPQLREQYDTDKNAVDFDMLTVSNGRKVWWKCSLGHSWEAVVASRTGSNARGCGVCAGKVVIPETSLAYLHPEVAALWSDRNTITAEQCAPRTSRKYWWKCEQGHEWEASPMNRVKQGDGCSYCSGRFASPGNNLLDCAPLLAAEFDLVKNNCGPADITPRSNKKFWWNCPEGHSYFAKVNHRNGPQQSGCSYCSGRYPSDINNLLAMFPLVAAEFDEDKNGMKVIIIMPSSSTKRWWKCAFDHEWQTTVASRTRLGRASGCPQCTGRLVSLTNNLAVCHPLIAAEFDLNKNSTTPDMVTPGSPNKHWWKCAAGHSWKATVGSRTGIRASGCSICSHSSFSKIETSIRREIIKTGILSDVDDSPNSVVNIMWRKNGHMNVDILGKTKEGRNIVVEYDGNYFHSGRAGKDSESYVRDAAKTQALLDADYVVIRIREQRVSNRLIPLPIIHENLFQLNYDYTAVPDIPALVLRLSAIVTDM